jgi:hypothetical protein
MTLRTKLLIETGRWFNISRENRICKSFEYKDIGGEFHYVFRCTDICIQKYCRKGFKNGVGESGRVVKVAQSRSKKLSKILSHRH